jgi:CubicO group peptidase (beta-lactamase class C family)
MKTPRCLLLGIVAALALCPVRSMSPQASAAQQIDAYITPFARAGHFSGVVLVAQGGKPVYEKAFGFADVERRIKNQLDTRIGIASVTKSMTAVILERIMDEKKLSLDDKLSKFIPDFPNAEKITVGILANHRSGIPHRVMPTEMENTYYTSTAMVQNIARAKLEFEPGTRDLYSSAGYSVLARVLEIAAGKTYSQLLEQYVFTPAGMKNSLDFDSRHTDPKRAEEYLRVENGELKAPAKDYSFLVGAGSVVSTARDLHAFAMALVNGMYGDSVRANYLRTKTFRSTGFTNGHRAEVRVNGERNYSYVLLANLNTGANDLILQAIRDIMEGKPVTPPVVPQPKFISARGIDLSQYNGVYEREGGSRITVTAKGQELYAGEIKFFPVRTDCFFEFNYYGEVCFIRDDSKAITHITWASPGITSKWVKQ